MDRVAMLSADDDIYSGYNEYPSTFDTRDLENDEIFRAAVLESSHGKKNVFKPGTSYRNGVGAFHGINSSLGYNASRLQTGNSRLSTGGSRLQTSMNGPIPTGKLQTALIDDDQVRPMTAVRGAGYTSGRPKTSMFDPMNMKVNGNITSGIEKRDETPEEKVKKMEKQLMELIEESCLLQSKGQNRQALEKSKEASSKERSLIRIQEQSGLSDHNLDLTCLVLFNLANQYSSNGMHSEALNTYQVITKNKMFVNASRFKINLGNIYFRLGEYSKALKMYRMAVDQVPSTQKSFRVKILHNIGRLFLQTGEIEEACNSYETIMQEMPNFEDGAKLIYSYHLLGDVEKMKKSFQLLLNVPSSIDIEKYSPASHDDVESQLFLEAIKNDDLRMWEKKEVETMEIAIFSSVKLIAPVIEDNYTAGYNWCLDVVKASRHASLAGDLDLDKVVVLLRSRELNAATDLLMSFQDREPRVASCAANNLSLIHYLGGDPTEAETWANRAKDLDSYSGTAYVNLGNIAFSRHQMEQAKEYYQIAYENDSTCVEALYNLSLVCKRMGDFEEGMGYLIKLETITRHDPQVLYQLGCFSEQTGDIDQATEWFLQLLGVMPSDPGVLHKMGALLERQGDHHQAFQYYHDSYKHFPCDLEVIDWIQGHYMSLGVPEKALTFLKKAAIVDPTDIKWKLLIAACYKRTGSHMKAIQVYKNLHMENPENIECLQLLTRLASELGLREAGEYVMELRRAEKAKEVRDRIGSSRPGSRKSTGSASRSSGFSPSSPNMQPSQSRSVPGSASNSHSAKMNQLRRGNSALAESPELYQIQEQGFQYDDPLGPLPERPRTSAGRKIADDDFGDEELGDELLPETVTCMRQFVTSSIYNTQSSDNKPTQTKTGFGENPEIRIRKVTTLTPLHRWALVFSGKYKSKADIPQYVPHEVLDKARSRVRIRLSNYFIVVTLFACLFFAYRGRKAAERGETITKLNMDWHKEYQAKVAKEKLEREAKSKSN